MNDLKLYNVQFMLELNKRLINKFVFAHDKDEAINYICYPYYTYKYDKDNIYCEEVNIIPGLTFNP